MRGPRRVRAWWCWVSTKCNAQTTWFGQELTCQRFHHKDPTHISSNTDCSVEWEGDQYPTIIRWRANENIQKG